MTSTSFGWWVGCVWCGWWWVVVAVRCNDFDIIWTGLSSLASTTAVSTVPCRVVYITLCYASC